MNLADREGVLLRSRWGHQNKRHGTTVPFILVIFSNERSRAVLASGHSTRHFARMRKFPHGVKIDFSQNFFIGLILSARTISSLNFKLNYSILSLFPILHLSHKVRRFDTTVLPPFETGTIWSMCSFAPSLALAPHS